MNIWETIFLQPLVNGLLVFYHLLTNNLGLAIIAFTIFTRLILIPVTSPSLKAMQKMRELSPEIEKLKRRHKDDKTKLMQAQADLYKRYGVNPAAGCLPQLVQIILLFALVQVFSLFSQGDINNVNKLAYEGLRLKEAIDAQFLYLDLTKPDTIPVSWLPVALPGPFLIVSAILQLVSSKMLTPAVKQEGKIAKQTSSQTDDIMASTQQQMLYLFPIMTIFIGYTFMSGLVLYWFVLSLVQVMQQYAVGGWGGFRSWLQRANLVKSTDNGQKDVS